MTPTGIPPTVALRARWVLPIDQRPIHDAEVIIDSGKITDLGPVGERPRDGITTQDLGDVALLPGLINAHAHLEFSDLEKPLGQAGASLSDWIGEVFQYRTAADRPALPQRVALGREQSTALGTALVADIDTGPAAETLPGPDQSAVEVLRFKELIALTDNSVAEASELFTAMASQRPYFGLSPHAPYTVRRDLLQRAAEFSAEQRFPLMMHLAETREELQLLATSDGPFATLLQSRDVWPADNFTPGLRPLDYLKLLAKAHRALVVHGNYLDEEELRFMAAHSDRLTLVYCPRTHAYFGHATHPIVEALQLGVAMAIGTDGRGSSPDLSLLAELRCIARAHPRIACAKVLELGTLDGAMALQCADRLGSITPGKQARLITIPLSSAQCDDPAADILLSNLAAQPLLVTPAI